MTKFARILTLCIVFVLAFTALSVVVAQDAELPGPGEGGIIIRGNTRGSGNLGSLLPIRCSGVDCSDPNALMWPGLIGLDPETQAFLAPLDGNLASGWEQTIENDVTVVTVSLRDDLSWNDGTPMTAKDVYFFWEATQQGEAIGMSSSFGPAAAALVNAEIVDDHTIKFFFENQSCNAINDVASMNPMPAHVFGYEPGAEFDWSVFIDHAYDDAPVVTSGPFNFSGVEPGTAVYMLANQAYEDTVEGFVRPTGFVYLDTPDENVMLERFAAFQPGDINFVAEPNAGFDTIINSGAQYLNAPGPVWHYMAINTADPSNPQNGLDADGNPIDQGKHPLFGDVRVRQALQHAVNIDEIVNGPHNGNATGMIGSTIPTAYTLHPDLERRAYDLEVAGALLDEAGWEATGDPLVEGGNGQRTCTTCETAAEGTPLEFNLLNPGGVRNDVSIIIQDQFADLGVKVNVMPLDFNTLYDDNMGAQTFDAAIAGWRGGVPFDPDQRSFFGAEYDIFGEGYGFNFGSYYNAEVEALGEAIASGDCSPEAITANAHRMQEILYEEQPYIWLYALNSIYAAAPNVANFNPYPGFAAAAIWNIDAWAVVE